MPIDIGKLRAENLGISNEFTNQGGVPLNFDLNQSSGYRDEVARVAQEREEERSRQEQLQADRLKAAEFYDDSSVPGSVWLNRFLARTAAPFERMLGAVGVPGMSERADEMYRYDQLMAEQQRQAMKGGIVPDVLQSAALSAADSLADAGFLAATGGLAGTAARSTGVAASKFGARTLGKAAYQGGRALGSQTGKQATMVLGFSGKGFDRSLTVGADNGLKGGDLTSYALKSGAAEGIPSAFLTFIGKLGMFAALSRGNIGKEGFKQGIKQAAKDGAAEVPEELTTELLQAWNDSTSINKEAISESLAAESIMEVALAAFMGGAGPGAVGATAAGGLDLGKKTLGMKRDKDLLSPENLQAKALEELRAEYVGIDKAINSEEFAQFPLEQQELLKSHANQFKTDLDSVIEQSKEGKNVLSELAKIHDRNTSFGETLRGMYEAPAAPEPTAEQAEVEPTEPEQAVPEPEATPQPQYRPLQDEDESPLGVYTKRDELQPDANFFEPEDGGSPALVRFQGYEDLYEVIAYDPNERTIQTLGEDGELYETSLDEEGVDLMVPFDVARRSPLEPGKVPSSTDIASEVARKDEQIAKAKSEIDQIETEFGFDGEELDASIDGYSQAADRRVELQAEVRKLQGERSMFAKQVEPAKERERVDEVVKDADEFLAEREVERQRGKVEFANTTLANLVNTAKQRGAEIDDQAIAELAEQDIDAAFAEVTKAMRAALPQDKLPAPADPEQAATEPDVEPTPPPAPVEPVSPQPAPAEPVEPVSPAPVPAAPVEPVSPPVTDTKSADMMSAKTPEFKRNKETKKYQREGTDLEISGKSGKWFIERDGKPVEEGKTYIKLNYAKAAANEIAAKEALKPKKKRLGGKRTAKPQPAKKETATDPKSVDVRAARPALSDIEQNVRSKFPDVDIEISGDKEKGYTLSKIVVPKDKRKQGVGQAAMRELTQFADKEGAIVKLTPSKDFGATSTARLKKFYKQFGFVENKGRNKDFTISETMYRLPAAKKRADKPAKPATPERDRVEAEARAATNDPEMVDAVMPLMDAVAQRWANATGNQPDAYFERIGSISFDGNKSQLLTAIKNDPQLTKSERARRLEAAREVNGYIYPDSNDKIHIALTNTQNKSTLVHELGHLYRYSLQEIDPKLLVKAAREVNKVLDQLGVKADRKIDLKDPNNWSREAEEVFAEGYEQYLETGQAPTPALKKIYEQMRQWLSDVYKALKQDERLPLTQGLAEVYETLSTKPVVRKKAKKVPSDSPRQGRLFQSGRVQFQTAGIRRGLDASARSRRRKGTLELLAEFGLDPAVSNKNRVVARMLERNARKNFGISVKRDDFTTMADLATKDPPKREKPAAKRARLGAKRRYENLSDKISNWMVEELKYAIAIAESNPERSAVGWYTTKYQDALNMLGKAFPEFNTRKSLKNSKLPGVKALGTRQNARDFFTALIAITSDGEKLANNYELAVDQYRSFRETGKLDTGKDFARDKSMKKNLKRIQDMMDDVGPAAMKDELLELKTVKSLKEKAASQGKEFTTPYDVKMELPYATLVFGPKLGAFYANLMGHSNFLTMDRWWSRTFNRYRGNLLTKPTESGLIEFRKKLHEAGLFTKKKAEGMPRQQLLKEATKYQESYKKRNYKKLKVESFEGENDLEAAANTIYKNQYENLQDAPWGARDRRFMIATTKKAQKKLEGITGEKMEIADIQAVLWYYEKELYSDLGAKDSGTDSYEEIAREQVARLERGGPDRSERSADEVAGRRGDKGSVRARADRKGKGKKSKIEGSTERILNQSQGAGLARRRQFERNGKFRAWAQTDNIISSASPPEVTGEIVSPFNYKLAVRDIPRHEKFFKSYPTVESYTAPEMEKFDASVEVAKEMKAEGKSDKEIITRVLDDKDLIVDGVSVILRGEDGSQSREDFLDVQKSRYQNRVRNFEQEKADIKKYEAENQPYFRTGKPVVAVAYHGSRAAKAGEFDASKRGGNTGAPSSKVADFFGGSPDTAYSYSGDGTEEKIPLIGYANLSVDDQFTVRMAVQRSIEDDFLSSIEYIEGNTNDAYNKKMDKFVEMAGFYESDFNEQTASSMLYEAKLDAEGRDDADQVMQFFFESLAEDLAIDVMPRFAAKNPEFVKDIAEGVIPESQMPEFDTTPVAPNIEEVYVRLLNPLVIDQMDESYREESYYDALVRAKKAGHDGAIWLNTSDPGGLTSRTRIRDNIFAVFSNDQITNYISGKHAATGKILFQRAQPANTVAEKSADIESAKKEWAEKGTDSKYFKKWFGKSKIVDDAGKPMVVYHGTKSAFNEFVPSLNGQLGPGIYMSTSKKQANFYALPNYKSSGDGGNVMPLYVKMENPLRIKSASYFQEQYPNQSEVNEVKEQGYDGIIQEFISVDDLMIVAFDKSQVKSATGNRGTFDDSGKILFQKNVTKDSAFTDFQNDVTYNAGEDVSGPFKDQSQNQQYALAMSKNDEFRSQFDWWLINKAKTNGPEAHDLSFKDWIKSDLSDEYSSFQSVGDLSNSEWLRNNGMPSLDLLRKRFKSDRDKPKVKDLGQYSDREKVFLRIDIPTYTMTGQYAVTLHPKIDLGTAEAYSNFAKLDGEVTFISQEGKATKIGRAEENKSPIASVAGKIASGDDYASIPADFDSWTPVGYNPSKVPFFYDKRSGKEVKNGTDAISIGNTIFVKEVPEDGYGTRNANLDPAGVFEYKQFNSPAFKKWFKKSVVSEVPEVKKGKTKPSPVPTVMYHATPAENDFDAFDLAYSKGQIGFHFGSQEQAKNLYGEDSERDTRLMEVYLSIQKPLRLTDNGSWSGRETVDELNSLINSKLRYPSSDSQIRKAILDAGYDGVVYQNEFESDGDSYIALKPEQIKSATDNQGTFSLGTANIYFQGGRAIDPVGMQERKRWFGKSKIVDEFGEPQQLYHGTPQKFTSFNMPTAKDSYNYFGNALYVTTNPEDAYKNYASDDAPDMMAKVERRAEEINENYLADVNSYAWNDPDVADAVSRVALKQQLRTGEQVFSDIAAQPRRREAFFEMYDRDLTIDVAEEMARKELMGSDPAWQIMPLIAKVEKPVYLDNTFQRGETSFEIEVELDDDGDIISETGSGVRLLEAIQAVENDYYGVEADAIAEMMMDGPVYAHDLFAAFQEQMIEDEEGNNAPGNFFGEVMEYLGYDGIVANANQYFGPKKIGGYATLGMAGITPDTFHVMVFHPRQLKSDTGNRGTYDDSSNILFQTAAERKAEFKQSVKGVIDEGYSDDPDVAEKRADRLVTAALNNGAITFAEAVHMLRDEIGYAKFIDGASAINQAWSDRFDPTGEYDAEGVADALPTKELLDRIAAYRERSAIAMEAAVAAHARRKFNKKKGRRKIETMAPQRVDQPYEPFIPFDQRSEEDKEFQDKARKRIGRKSSKRPISKRNIIARWQSLFGVPIREGGPKGSEGAYYAVHPEMIRMKNGNLLDVAIAAHEIAHHIDNELDLAKLLRSLEKNDKKRFQKVSYQLAYMDYDKSAKRSEEGFAEAVRHLLTNTLRMPYKVIPEYNALNNYRDALEWVHETIINSKFREPYLEAEVHIDMYDKQSLSMKVQSQIGDQTDVLTPGASKFRNLVADSVEKARTVMINRLLPVRRLDEEAAKAGYKGTKLENAFLFYKNYVATGVSNVVQRGVTSIRTGDVLLSSSKTSIDDLGKLIKNDEQDVVQYAVASHVLFMEKQRPEYKGPITPKQARDTLKRLNDNASNEDKKRYEAFKKGVNDILNDLLMMRVDAGELSANDAFNIQEFYGEDMFSFLRVQEDTGKKSKGGASNQRVVNLGVPIKGRTAKGTDTAIMHPIDALIQKTQEAYEGAARARLVTMLAEIERLPGMGSIIFKVKPDMKVTKESVTEALDGLREANVLSDFHVKALRIGQRLAEGKLYTPVTKADGDAGLRVAITKKEQEIYSRFHGLSAGLSLEDLQQHAENNAADITGMIQFFNPSFQPNPKKNTVRVNNPKSGETEMWEIGDQELYDVLTGITPDDLGKVNSLVRILQKPFRAGAISLNLAFGSANLIRDYLEYQGRSRYLGRGETVVKPLVHMAKLVKFGLVQFFSPETARERFSNDLLDFFQETGGALTSRIGFDVESRKRERARIVGKRTKGQKAKGLFTEGVDKLQDLIAISDMPPRMAEGEAFLQTQGITLEKGKFVKDGKVVKLSEEQRIGLAYAMAEATTNFSRSGTVGPYMNVYLPFFNASMQGTARFAKQAESLVKHLTGKEMTAEEKREGANAMWYTAIGVLAATAYAFNPFEDDDEDYLEARATDRDRFWLVGWNGTTHARIPKPRDTAFLFNLIETIGLNVRRKQAADSGNSFGDLALRDLVARIPTGGGIVRSGVEVFANYDTFRGREIESQYMTSGRNPVPKFLRTDAYTSSTADALGLAASKIPILENLSPKQIEFLLQGYSGGGYKRLATMLEGLLGVGKRDLTLRDFPGSSAFVVNRYQAGSIGDLYDQAEDVGMQLAIARHNAPPVTDKASYAEYESYYNENISGLAQKKARLEEAAELMATIREMEDKTEGGQRTFELEPYINGVAREALGRDRLESAMNIFEAKELPPKLEEAIKEHVLRKAKVAVALYGMPTKVAESDSLYEQTLDKYEAKVAAHRDWINRNKDSEVIKRAVGEAYSSSKMRSMFSMPRVKTKEEADNFRVRFERQRDLIKSLKEDIGN